MKTYHNRRSADNSNYQSGPPAAPQSPRVQCGCPGCHLPRLQRLEEFNAQLARANDALRRERDQLAAQLAGRKVA
jgi:hypothetical protein